MKIIKKLLFLLCIAFCFNTYAMNKEARKKSFYSNLLKKNVIHIQRKQPLFSQDKKCTACQICPACQANNNISVTFYSNTKTHANVPKLIRDLEKTLVTTDDNTIHAVIDVTPIYDEIRLELEQQENRFFRERCCERIFSLGFIGFCMWLIKWGSN